MALGFYFAPQSMSSEQYDEVMRRLEAAGQRSPAGRLYHVAFSGGEGLHVFDIWGVAGVVRRVRADVDAHPRRDRGRSRTAAGRRGPQHRPGLNKSLSGSRLDQQQDSLPAVSNVTHAKTSGGKEASLRSIKRPLLAVVIAIPVLGASAPPARVYGRGLRRGQRRLPEDRQAGLRRLSAKTVPVPTKSPSARGVGAIPTL